MSHQYAPTATTDITLTLARPTATTDLTGLLVECLSAPARGMAGDAVGVGVVGVMATMVEAAGATDTVITVVAATPEDAASLADGALSADADLRAVRRVDSAVVAGSVAEL